MQWKNASKLAIDGSYEILWPVTNTWIFFSILKLLLINDSLQMNVRRPSHRPTLIRISSVRDRQRKNAYYVYLGVIRFLFVQIVLLLGENIRFKMISPSLIVISTWNSVRPLKVFISMFIELTFLLKQMLVTDFIHFSGWSEMSSIWRWEDCQWFVGYDCHGW